MASGGEFGSAAGIVVNFIKLGVGIIFFGNRIYARRASFFRDRIEGLVSGKIFKDVGTQSARDLGSLDAVWVAFFELFIGINVSFWTFANTGILDYILI